MKYLSIVRYAIMIISVVLALLFFTGVMGDDQAADVLLRWGYIVMGIAVASVIVFPLLTLSQNPKGALRGLIGLGALVVLVGICYLFASDAPVYAPGAVYDDPAVLKLTDTELYVAYVMLIVTIGSILFCEIKNSFK